jgi:ankyrin repeat protein
VIGDGFTGFVVASPQSEWCAALKRRDCQTLLRLLQRKHNLWREIDSNGRTVLHVAVMQGCSRLVNEVLRSVNKYNSPNTTSALDMLENAKDTSLCGADVFHIADIVGNEVVRSLIDGLATDIQPAEQFPDANNVLSDRIQYILDNLDHEGTESLTLKEAFEDDVDYNFVEHGQGLFCLHVACKHVQLVDFLQRVMRHTKNGGNHLLQALFELKDAQGRTLLHVAVEEDGLSDNSRDTHMANIVTKALGILVEEPACDAVTSQNCLNARDLAGRTPLHRAVANKRAGRAVIKALLDHPMTDVNALWRSDNVSTGNVTALHLAVLHNNVDAARSLLARDITDGDITCKLFIEASGIRSRNDDNPKLSGRSWTALELATIMGEVHMVDAMLKVCD